LWLDPAFGFAAVVILAIFGASVSFAEKIRLPGLRWSMLGSALTLGAWLVDRSPWSPAAGELRYLHPCYALAWFGLGLALNGAQSFRTGQRRKRGAFEMAGAALLILPLAFTQITHGYAGWLYSSVWMRRITSLDEVIAYASLRDWLHAATSVEIVFVSLPFAMTVALLALTLWRARSGQAGLTLASLIPPTIVVTVLFVFTFMRVRWGVLATLVAIPVAWQLAVGWKPPVRLGLAAVSLAFLLGLAAWKNTMPAAYHRPSIATQPRPADVEALVHRHFAHWLASHTPGEAVSALAPPELSDSLVFHGGARVVMSTAWESYPGQLAANRILSALESTEAQAVIEGHQLTHVILPSWDRVLPLFVQTPKEDGKDTLFDRLQRWVYPPFLRPIPYRLPPIPAFAAEKLAVFKVTPSEDEAISLSRLAEYFVEMNRPEPATMAAQVLAASYSHDPNAAIARATVYAHANQQALFERELARLVADSVSGKYPMAWDRRAQRAIVLALGRQHILARKEVEALFVTASRQEISDLTSLQAYRLRVLAHGFRISFSDPTLSTLLAALGAEYSTAARDSTDR
jgi:hypothetical protein